VLDSNLGNSTTAIEEALSLIVTSNLFNSLLVSTSNNLSVNGTYTATIVSPVAINVSQIVITDFNYADNVVTFLASDPYPIVCDWMVDPLGSIDDDAIQLTQAEVMNCTSTQSPVNCGSVTMDSIPVNVTANIGDLTPGFYRLDTYCSYNLPQTPVYYTSFGKINVPNNIITNASSVAISVCIPGITDSLCSGFFLQGGFNLIMMFLFILLTMFWQ